MDWVAGGAEREVGPLTALDHRLEILKRQKAIGTAKTIDELLAAPQELLRKDIAGLLRMMAELRHPPSTSLASRPPCNLTPMP